MLYLEKVKVVKIFDVQTLGKEGQFKKREFIVEWCPVASKPDFVERMKLELWNERVDQNMLSVGELVSVSYNSRCEEYKGRWYNSMVAYVIQHWGATDAGVGGMQGTSQYGVNMRSEARVSPVPQATVTYKQVPTYKQAPVVADDLSEELPF